MTLLMRFEFALHILLNFLVKESKFWLHSRFSACFIYQGKNYNCILYYATCIYMYHCLLVWDVKTFTFEMAGLLITRAIFNYLTT